MFKTNYHITTAIPYVNAQPHLGHILEWFQADAIAEYQRMLGKDVSFTSGADENSLKNVQVAEKNNVPVQNWLDEYSQIYEKAYKKFGISLTEFRRGSDQKKHWPGVQELWKLCNKKGDIYKKKYKGLYCVGCESYYSKEELVNGKCPEHLKKPTEIEEENYFFKLSKYQKQIKELIKNDKLLIVSEQYKKEMLGFINQGLEDFSISRTKERARGVGVPIPDDDQVMYVWFDALTIYMTAIGWNYNLDKFNKYWPADVHVIGKGINRFHSVYWIGILLSAGLKIPKSISVHGYITADGQKMSKSLGNVIDPFTLIKKYPLEAIRFYLLAQIPTHSDGDFTVDKFKEAYTAYLANGYGNLCSRIAKMCEKNTQVSVEFEPTFSEEYQKLFDKFEIHQAFQLVWKQIQKTDLYLTSSKPWELNGKEQAIILNESVKRILSISWHLKPFMPKTAKTILQHFSSKNIPALKPLFPRLDK